ncbi:MAG: hypothetical protein WBA44_09255, partial [Mesorhizobium sp.]
MVLRLRYFLVTLNHAPPAFYLSSLLAVPRSATQPNGRLDHPIGIGNQRDVRLVYVATVRDRHQR